MRKIFDRVRALFQNQVAEIEPVEVRGQEIYFRCSRDLDGGEQRFKLPSGEVTIKVKSREGDIYNGRLVTAYQVPKGQKRRPRRFPVRFQVDADSLGGVTTENVSSNGLKVTLDRKVGINQEVEMKLTSPDTVSKIKVKSVCVWCRPGPSGKFEAGFHMPDLLDWERSWLKRRCLESLTLG